MKTGTTVKEVISDESIEIMRDGCQSIRDLAMIDLLYSTGMRVGELVNLDIADIDFEERECVVYGKGNKERRVYFEARTKLHIQEYLKIRSDKNAALFVTLNAPYERFIVEGPTADDTIWNFVNDYLAGGMSRNQFWAMAEFKYPTHQMSFHTLTALNCLKFERSDVVYDGKGKR